MRQGRIILVIGMLQTVVAFHRHRMGQFHLETRRLKAIDQPVPVVGRLHHDTNQFSTMRLKQ